MPKARQAMEAVSKIKAASSNALYSKKGRQGNNN